MQSWAIFQTTIKPWHLILQSSFSTLGINLFLSSDKCMTHMTLLLLMYTNLWCQYKKLDTFNICSWLFVIKGPILSMKRTHYYIPLIQIDPNKDFSWIFPGTNVTLYDCYGKFHHANMLKIYKTYVLISLSGNPISLNWTSLMFWRKRVKYNFLYRLPEMWKRYMWPLLLTWFNFNPSMDK